MQPGAGKRSGPRLFNLILCCVPVLAQAQDCTRTLLRASELYESRNYGQSARLFQEALPLCPQRLPVLLNIAKSQFMEQAFEAASETLDDAVRRDPANPTALKLRGDVLYLLGQEQEAEKSILTAIKYDPHNPEPYYALGRIYYQQNRFAESIAQFSKVLELDPKSFRAHDNMGLAFEGLNNNTRAMEQYQRALALVHKDHPDYDWVYGNVSNLLYKEGNYSSAFQFAAEAANRNPSSGRNFYLGGKALARLGKPDLAAKWLEKALTLDASLSEAHYQYAHVLRKIGKPEDADRELKIFQETKVKEPQKRR